MPSNLKMIKNKGIEHFFFCFLKETGDLQTLPTLTLTLTLHLDPCPPRSLAPSSLDPAVILDLINNHSHKYANDTGNPCVDDQLFRNPYNGCRNDHS